MHYERRCGGCSLMVGPSRLCEHADQCCMMRVLCHTSFLSGCSDVHTARTGRKRRIANWQFVIREMQHCGALITRARGAQSFKPFATTLHDVCGSVVSGWQQNPPFDQWDLAVLRATCETRAVQLVTALGLGSGSGSGLGLRVRGQG